MMLSTGKRRTRASRAPRSFNRTEDRVVDPLEYLLVAMNDERLTPMQQLAIAEKLAPYFHPKLKPISAEQAAANFEFLDVEGGQEHEAEAIAAKRESLRRRLFDEFD
jgi:hypothetical protein